MCVRHRVVDSRLPSQPNSLRLSRRPQPSEQYTHGVKRSQLSGRPRIESASAGLSIECRKSKDIEKTIDNDGPTADGDGAPPHIGHITILGDCVRYSRTHSRQF
ncbi:hypothetical protein Ddc_19215 [Ditylenchus destructor]|nr:hypothetical protein Ddc_19215 [Ditylenchus destructor]